MSENIQSISQGTYTIGQTSATNFIAGNGIKIDEPSAGTVRIGTDETVLWSAPSTANATSAGNFNENPFNFERIGVYWLMNNDGTLQGPTYEEFPTLPNTTYYLNAGFGNSYCYIGKVHFNVGSASFSSTKAQGIQIAGWNNTASVASIDTNYLTKMRNGFYKIVGLNRISGSNA